LVVSAAAREQIRLAAAVICPNFGNAFIAATAHAVEFVTRWVLLVIVLMIALGFIEFGLVQNLRDDGAWQDARAIDRRGRHHQLDQYAGQRN